MHKRVARQVAIDKSRTSTNTFKCKPQQHIAVAVAAIKSNDLIPLDSQIVHKPVADSLYFQVELLVSPLRSFELQEHMVRPVLLCPPFQDVIVEQLVLGLLLGDECERLCGSIVQVADFEIVAYVELCVQVRRRSSDAGYSDSRSHCGYISIKDCAVQVATASHLQAMSRGGIGFLAPTEG